MLTKLIKYDLRNLFRQMLPFYIITLASTGILFLCYYLPASNFRHIIVDYLTQAVIITLICSTLFNTFIRAWIRFRLNLYADESYLTHTLPVTRGQLLGSKAISSIITIIASCAVCAASFLIINIHSGITERLFPAISSAAEIMRVSPVILTLVFALLILAEFAVLLFSGYSGVVLGHCFDSGRVSKGVAFGAAIYILSQIFLVVFIRLSVVFWPGIRALFGNETIDPRILLTILLVSIAGYLIYFIFQYLLTHFILHRCVNVE